MGTYRVEWPCCGSATETEAWEPEQCPFCEPDNAAPDLAKLRDATDEEVAELEEEVREASARVAELESEYALARFGAYVVRDWFRRTSGFQAADGHQLDAGATEMGVVMHGATVGFRCSPGIREAIARLLAPDGAASEGVTG